ncbi:aminotransferase class V-fold PLP-dependent enzyme [Celeribacter halophilus]|uniref:Selenocysteine lyase/Cysteine desulfurase n=1 Tax=Celeribacter halophilus TaxID=576117 RepID=A0A1I3W182_9RHOB|nr:aminotransferase class V-fold PLP-dependent enzyme [Celeribacter halophilus]PZX06854.1 selenocysteine lyase/cysteine desulfurase [Celeribacter halophilus]SFK01235.1 Selenocysteine lyase/Cysteine desulfurase [Celeribacter halophilus]
MNTQACASLLNDFRMTVPKGTDLAADLIGKDASFDGPYGKKEIVYADYVASGRALMSVERFVLEKVLPYYANSHTEASFCGGFMTRLRNQARAVIAAHCGADEGHAVIFSGSGATAGLNRLVRLMGADWGRVKIIIGPYEHHSNILPWRESGAEVIELPESSTGGPDMHALETALKDVASYDRVICSFSAASNVTGIIADVKGITRRVKAAGAKIVWDYAGGGPYLPISMSLAEGAEIDAMVFSPHKFIGGPGASGVLIIRRDAVVSDRPTWVGGGTVRFVSSQTHDYSLDLEHREEAGTPNVIGDIRAALAVIVKEQIGQDVMTRRNRELSQRAMTVLQDAPMIDLLGLKDADRLPILSFRVRHPQGGFLHQQLATKILSDRYGIQARGGCACAGPYVLRLLGVDNIAQKLREEILDGNEMEKPGFVRLNLSVLMTDGEVDFILRSILSLSEEAARYVGDYQVDSARAIFTAKAA